MFGNVKGFLKMFRDARYARKQVRDWPDRFDSVSAYCMFIGYPRSSHSLMGSLIDAHPNAIIAHEQDVLKYIRYGFTKDEIFPLLLRNSEEFTAGGRTWTGYSYAVKGHYQGRYETLKIIGDKRGANSARRLQRKPGMLEKLKSRIGIPIKIIHVIRNPYDNISTMAYRNNGSQKERVTKAALKKEVENYFGLVGTVAWVKGVLDTGSVIDIKTEEFMVEPKGKLADICNFLGLAANDKYLSDCAAIVYNKPHKTRNDYPWDQALIAEVGSRMKAFSFFDGYGFDE